MDTFKATAILKILTGEELYLLKEYISQPSTRCRPQAIDLFAILYEHNGNIPRSKSAISRLTGVAPKRLNDLMNKLLGHIEDFCALQSLIKETSEIEYSRHLLAFYSERGLIELFGPCYQKNEKQMKNHPANFPVEHLDTYYYYTDLAIHDKIQKGRKLSVRLSDYAHHLDVFFCLEKLKLICERMNRNNISNEPIDENGNFFVLEMAKQYANQYPLVQIYLSILEFQKIGKVSDDKFAVLFGYITNIKSTWTSYNERISICHYLINMCLRAVKNGNPYFQKRFIDLIIYMESQELLLERKTISAPIFSAVIRIGLKEKGISWTSEFFKKYAGLLPAENKREIVAFSEALILFSQKNYSLAERKLNLIELSAVDVYYKMNIHKLRIKILMEENLEKGFFDISIVDHKLRNFGLFLNHKSLGEPNRRELKKFNLYVKKIAANYGIRKRRNAVLAKLHKESQVAEKDWLLSLFDKRA